MKYFILLFILMPTNLVGQKIQCVDTVTRSGYFLRVKNNSLAPEAFLNDTIYFHFLPESAVAGRNIVDVFRYIDTVETETIKYLSFRPRQSFSGLVPSSCRQQFEMAINVNPFFVGQHAYRLKGYKGRRLQVSYATVKWLHIKIKKSIACPEGFDRPASLFCDLAEDKWFDIYLPLDVLSLQQSVPVRRGKIFSGDFTP